MRRCAVLIVLSLLVACSSGGAATIAATSEPGPKLLFFANPQGVTVFDAGASRVALTVPDGMLAPDRSAVFGATVEGAGTVVRAHDPASGGVRDVATVDGKQQLRVANHDGSAVVLAPPRVAVGDGYPPGRPTTTLTIVRTDGGPSRSVEVAGNVEPEAFSHDDTNLFVLQYLPAEAPVGYQVRRVDLATGELHNVRTDDSDLDKPMAGRARTQVLSPDGTRLYTLYVVADETRQGGGYAFVHVLDLVAKTAFCVDLPSPFGTGAPSSYAVAIARDGAHLYSIDPQHGVIADLDTASMAITRTVSMNGLQSASASVSAAVGAGGRLFLAAGTELLAVEPISLTIESRYGLTGTVAAVLTTAFDEVVYVAVDDTISAFNGDDIGSGPGSSTQVPGAPGLVAADPVPPVDARGPTQCAC